MIAQTRETDRRPTGHRPPRRPPVGVPRPKPQNTLTPRTLSGQADALPDPAALRAVALGPVANKLGLTFVG